MKRLQVKLSVQTKGRGLYLITDQVRALVAQHDLASIESGIAHIFIQHTSASLLIQENASPTARKDLENFIDRLIPENQSWYEHLDEGPDDTVSHLKSSITSVALTIPIAQGKLLLGTWQGIYLWEHRRAAHVRNLVITLL